MAATRKIIGFDPASVRNLGWSRVAADGTKVVQCDAGTFVIDKVEEPWQALWPIMQVVDDFLKNEAPDLVVVEQTKAFGGFVGGQVASCMGVIHACCGKHGVKVGFVHPTHLKKVLTGNGRATKTQVKNAVIAAFDKKFDSEHAYDAVAVILSYLQDEESLT